MGFRTIVIKNRAKLDFCLNYMVCRGEKESRIHVSEISTLIIESTAVSVTAALLMELVKAKVKVIFCDSKHLPHSQLMGYDNNYHSAKAIMEQAAWGDVIKSEVWKEIVKRKITNQDKLLSRLGVSKNNALATYAADVLDGDSTNREGHAAKVYFNLLGSEGRREDSEVNTALNYGYAVLLSSFCRAITASGLITQLGVWHCSEFNPYNLASDLMETFRVIVDDIAFRSEGKDFKVQMANLTNAQVNIAGKWQYLESGIDIYVKSVIKALKECNVSCIKNYTDYEVSFYESDNNV